MSLEGGALVWTFTEPDGHALTTYASNGAERSFEVLGAYGAPISGLGHGSWAIDAFHGSDPDRVNGVVPHPLPTYVGRRSM